MLEHVPGWLGRALAGMRAGADKLVIAGVGIGDEAAASGGAAAIDLSSPAFANGGRLPPRFTADGAGVSPPLVWGDPPAGTARMVLVVEDADAPAPQPLVHAIVWGIAPEAGRLAEGAIVRDGDGGADGRDVGRHSFLGEGWLPPDPPTGHGEHRYAFQLFAVGTGAGDPGATPGRGDVVAAIAGHVLAAGLLVGTYSRGTPVPAGTGRVTATA